ncbi:ATP-binding protein, partial [Echinicola sediminis]
DSIICISLNGVINYCNRASCELLGYKEMALVGKSFEELFPKGNWPGFDKVREAIFSNHTFAPMLLEKSGEGELAQALSVQFSPIVNEKDHIVGISAIIRQGGKFGKEAIGSLETENGTLIGDSIRDIGESKEVQKVLEEFDYQLQIKNKELDQFAYVASHDLREPLKTLSSFTEFLSTDYGEHFDEMGRKSIQFITEATGRMEQLIKGLLEYNRIGKEGSLEIVDCHLVIGEVIDNFSSYIKATGAVIKVGNLPKISAYKKEIAQLFQNLIINGIKFRRKEVKPEIAISVEKQEGSWLFAVKDNGIGIADHYHERIFMLFQRLHNREKYTGNGIGLAHCHKIVALHGGQIWLESEISKGSTFYFTIPCD